MKKIMLLTAIGLITLVSFTTVKAEDNRTEERLGYGSGLIIGALTGGPVGAIIGAVSGAWIGDKINEAEKVEPMEQQIARNKIHLLSLQKSIAKQNQYIDKSNLLLAKQQASQQKVARNNDLITGLQVDLMFRSNSRQLETTSVEKIAPLIIMLEHFPQLELELTGHGDILGSDDGNKIVAYERTLAVRQSFIDAGVDQQRIHLQNSGRSLAEAAIDDVDGRALDRRVRIRFMHTIDNASLAFQQN